MELNIIKYYLPIIRTNIIIIAIIFNLLVFINIILIIIINIMVIRSHTINIIVSFIIVIIIKLNIITVAIIITITIVVIIIVTIIINNLGEIYLFSINNPNSRCFMLGAKMTVCFLNDFLIQQWV